MFMKRILILISLVFICLTAFSQTEKAAVLMVHFGTSEAEGRALSLDAVNRDVKAAFPELEVRQAYASGIIRKKLEKEGLKIQGLQEALMQLCADGYQQVYVQSSTLMEGIEMSNIREIANDFKSFFKTIKVGNPLLYSVEDCRKVLEILTDEPAEKNQGVILVGHGTTHPSTATYAMLQMMLRERGLDAWFVSTIEGYPTQEMTINDLKHTKAKRVLLRPLLLTAGDHARNDIAKEWKSFFEQQGYEVSVKLQGLGELPAIRTMYVEHIREMIDEVK